MAKLPGRELENPPENRCWVCGPGNPEGMRLRYFDDGEVVRAALEPRPGFVGWEGSWNAGLVVAALGDIAGWAGWERLGGPCRPAGDATLEFLGPLPLAPLTIEGRAEEAGGVTTIVTEALQEGQVRIRASAPFRPLTPEEARQMAPRVPPSLRPDFEARARGKESRPAVTSSRR